MTKLINNYFTANQTLTLQNFTWGGRLCERSHNCPYVPIIIMYP